MNLNSIVLALGICLLISTAVESRLSRRHYNTYAQDDGTNSTGTNSTGTNSTGTNSTGTNSTGNGTNSSNTTAPPATSTLSPIDQLKKKYNISTPALSSLKLHVAQATDAGLFVKFGADAKNGVPVSVDSVGNQNWVAAKGCQDAKSNGSFSVNTFGGSKSYTSSYSCSGSCSFVKTDNATVSQVSVVHKGVASNHVSVTGLLAQDNLVAGNISLANVSLLVVSNISNGKLVNHLGALSFAINANSVPALAKAQKQTKNAIWSTYLFNLFEAPKSINTKEQYTMSGRGFVSLGGALPIPDKFWDVQPIVAGSENYAVALGSVTLGSTDLGVSGTKAIFSTNLNGLALPTSVLAAVKAQIIANGGFAEADCSTDAGNWNCNGCGSKAGALPSFTFKFGSSASTYLVKGEDYAYFTSSDKCQFELKDGGANFVLGNYFLRRNYVAFDQDNSQVKLSTFPQADLQVLASYYIGQIWSGANLLMNSLISFFGLVLLGFALCK